MPELIINLTTEAIKRINQIIEGHEIFENREDFIQHAIIDQLEKYNEK